MRHIITTIAFVLISLTISAKTVVKNPATGKVLDNTMGVYSIKGTPESSSWEQKTRPDIS